MTSLTTDSQSDVATTKKTRQGLKRGPKCVDEKQNPLIMRTQFCLRNGHVPQEGANTRHMKNRILGQCGSVLHGKIRSSIETMFQLVQTTARQTGSNLPLSTSPAADRAKMPPPARQRLRARARPGQLASPRQPPCIARPQFERQSAQT